MYESWRTATVHFSPLQQGWRMGRGRGRTPVSMEHSLRICGTGRTQSPPCRHSAPCLGLNNEGGMERWSYRTICDAKAYHLMRHVSMTTGHGARIHGRSRVEINSFMVRLAAFLSTSCTSSWCPYSSPCACVAILKLDQHMSCDALLGPV